MVTGLNVWNQNTKIDVKQKAKKKGSKKGYLDVIS